MFNRVSIGWAVALAAWFGCAGPMRGDEGMWLFSSPPVEHLQQNHGMTVTPGWLLHLQRSSVRFSSGGSGAFVSADGLVLTNHHVGADAIQKLGDPAHDYLREGFAAATRADELACHDLELNVLMSIEDVTERVQAAVTAGMSADEAFAARRSAMAAIENESLAATGLRSDVVTLYQGGAYHLYRAKKYTDVRLVFAPEQQIAFFGGDADNFEFPRFNLDICFFRAYENGRPARVDHHLAWAGQGVAAGDLVFVSGHPGHTDRANTVSELVSLRDRRLPLDLQILNRLEAVVGAYAAEGPEERRQARQDLLGIENGRKARSGVLAGLLEPRIMAAKMEAEARLRKAPEAERLGAATPYERIEEAQHTLDGILVRHRLLEGAAAFNSQYFWNARAILRATAERGKPGGERLREYRDSNLESLEHQLFSDEPIYDAFEVVKLADSLTFLATTLGGDDELVRQVLAGLSPRDRAAELVAGTTLGRRPPGGAAAAAADTRRTLYDGGTAAVAASMDAMLGLARLVDAESRRVRGIAEAAQEVKQQAHGEIARARFARAGAAVYPDATFTLRLAFGTVRGCGATDAADSPFTAFGGLFARAAANGETPPFDLPPRWRTFRDSPAADAAFRQTHFNFVSTADIIGGNSGSPVVNRAGELVGVIFDGNIDSLVLDIAYDDLRARAVAVDATAIIAALQRVYRVEGLVRELVAGAARDR